MKHILPAELQAKLKAASPPFLVDVREQDEHDVYNIGGLLLPLPCIMKQHAQIPKESEVIVYCKMGIRSQIAIQRLEERYGFTNLVNLRGGMEAWRKMLTS